MSTYHSLPQTSWILLVSQPAPTTHSHRKLGPLDYRPAKWVGGNSKYRRAPETSGDQLSLTDLWSPPLSRCYFLLSPNSIDRRYLPLTSVTPSGAPHYLPPTSWTLELPTGTLQRKMVDLSVVVPAAHYRRHSWSFRSLASTLSKDPGGMQW